MNIDLAGRTALVTGSTRGIGRAIAETLAGAGARVAVVGRDAAARRGVGRAIGDGAAGFACDVADAASVTALVESVEKAFGQIDILVNNAGLTRDNILFRLKDDDWDAVLDANLRGAFVAISRRVAGDDEAPLGTHHQHRERGRGSPATRGRRTTRRARPGSSGSRSRSPRSSPPATSSSTPWRPASSRPT